MNFLKGFLCFIFGHVDKAENVVYFAIDDEVHQIVFSYKCRFCGRICGRIKEHQR